MPESLFTQFQRRLSALGGEVVSVEDIAQGAALIAERARQGDSSVVVPPIAGSTALWQQALPLLREMDITIKESAGAASVADAPVGLSGAELAIAETGSLMLADNALEARVVSMLALTHIVLIAESAIVPTLNDAGARLRELTRSGPNQRHYISLITSSSRTSDIERVLTIGVQGPKALCVIVVKG